MRRRIAMISLLTAWLLATGSQWDVVQVFAWGKMFAGYVQTLSVRQALAETFDADKPCSLCCAVREAKRQENKQVPPEIRLREKLTLVFQPTTDFLASVSIETSWPEAGSLQAGRGRAEPTVPPPRSLGLLG